MAARNAEKVELKEILQRADYVTMHCPRTEETFGMIGNDELSLMKPTAFFINTSRGGTYRESDLARALAERRSPAPASMSSSRNRRGRTIR